MTSDKSGVGSGLCQEGGPAFEAKSCQCSELQKCEQTQVIGDQSAGSFWVFNAQIRILPHSRDSFSLIFDS